MADAEFAVTPEWLASVEEDVEWLDVEPLAELGSEAWEVELESSLVVVAAAAVASATAAPSK